MMERRPASLAFVAGLCAPAVGFAQTLGQGRDPSIDLARVAAGLLLCLGLAVAAALLLRRRQGLKGGLDVSALSALWAGPAPSARRVRVLERTRVTPQLEMILVGFEGKEWLLAATPSGGFLVSGPAAPRDA